MITTLLLVAAAAPFGSAGTIVPGGQVRLSHETFDSADVPAVTFMSAYIGPELDYFVFDDVSLSLGLGLGAAAFEDVTYTNWSVRGGVGYHLGLSDDVGLYPRASITLDFAHASGDAVYGGPNDSRTVRGELYAPMLYHADHFFVGMGPLLSKTFFDAGTNVTLALATTIGGWF